MQLNEDNSLIVVKEPDGTAAADVELKATDEDPEIGPELDIVINNVVCSFSVRCHLNLRVIALNGSNVEYRRENGMVTMRLRRPYTTASVWSSGRITCTGATSETQAKVAARRFARCLSKLGFPVHFQNFRIFNVLGTCSMPWSIRIVNFSEQHRSNACYEPELHPGVTYKMCDPKATLKIFSTGSVTVTAANVNTVELAIQRIYPLVHEFRNEKSKKDLQKAQVDNKAQSTAGYRTPNTSWRPKVPIYSSTKVLDCIPTTSKSNNTINTATNITSNSTANSSTTSTSSSSSSSGDTILSNARRRATECWVNKLQNKRSRYNDANAMSKVTALARSVAANKPPLPAKVVFNQAKTLTLPGTSTSAPGLPGTPTANRQLGQPVEDSFEETNENDVN